MVTDAFGTLLEELSKALNIKDLKPDNNNSCLIKFPSGVKIQMEVDRKGNYLILGCDLGEIPPGRYRENVFREALKSNGQMPPRHGDFAYSKHADHLVLLEMIPLKNLTGEKIGDEIHPFLEKARTWKEALSRGDIPSSIQGAYASKGGSGMFGLR